MSIFFFNSYYIQGLSSWVTIEVGTVQDGLYHLLLSKPKPSLLQAFFHNLFPSIYVNHTFISTFNQFMLWHYRLEHSCMTKHILHDVNHNFKYSDHSQFPCDVCPLAKQHKTSFPKSKSKATRPFHIVSVDIWGQNPTQSYNGAKYFLSLVDQFTQCTWIYLLKNKVETRTSLMIFFCTHWDPIQYPH